MDGTMDDDLIIPDLDGIPEDDTAEPADADVAHEVPAEEIERLIAEDEG